MTARSDATTFPLGADADRRLAVDAAAGDERAFARLFEIHRDAVYRIARAVTGDRETALDAVQETFLKVHEGLAAFRAESSLRTWIVRIAVRAAIDQRRRARKHPGPSDAAEPSHDPRMRLEDALALEKVQRMAAELPGQQGLILRLRLLAGLTNAEVAAALSLNEPNVRMQVSKAVRRLREML